MNDKTRNSTRRSVVGGKESFVQSVRSLSRHRRASMIKPEHAKISIVEQCELVSISRSLYYYEGNGESGFNLELMRLTDKRAVQREAVLSIPPNREGFSTSRFMRRP